MSSNFYSMRHQETSQSHQGHGSVVNETTTSFYEQSRRQVSSVVIAEEFLEPLPETEKDVYEEVPVIEERIVKKPVKKIIEVEKVIPKYEVEYVDKIREIPQIEYVTREVEREIVQDVTRHVPVKRVMERPKEVIKTVPKVEYTTVEKIVHVPGKVIEVPKLVNIHQDVEVVKRVDKPVPVVVAQTINPVITESMDVIDVDVYEYIPKIIPVDVHVAKLVESQLMAVGPTQHLHHPVSVPAAQYNSLLRGLNKHLPQDEQMHLPYMKLEDGSLPFLRPDEVPEIVYPVQDSQLINSKGSMLSGSYSYSYPTYRQVTNQSNRIMTHANINGLQQQTTCETMASKPDDSDLRSMKSVTSVQKSLKSAKFATTRLPRKKIGCTC